MAAQSQIKSSSLCAIKTEVESKNNDIEIVGTLSEELIAKYDELLIKVNEALSITHLSAIHTKIK